ncbi:hypothetical protein OS493_012242 [Desmophyllum pertusum]|uniref:Zinc finger PHD-type domain-containing protein n=1 Tax=Desmophyllum pertusum TaxID=174260 RepID=A0A9W9ZTX4_9CNID|nr:hypothetical protein OS493_012242 [Desmophyllum pertusum]
MAGDSNARKKCTKTNYDPNFLTFTILLDDTFIEELQGWLTVNSGEIVKVEKSRKKNPAIPVSADTTNSTASVKETPSTSTAGLDVTQVRKTLFIQDVADGSVGVIKRKKSNTVVVAEKSNSPSTSVAGSVSADTTNSTASEKETPGSTSISVAGSVSEVSEGGIKRKLSNTFEDIEVCQKCRGKNPTKGTKGSRRSNEVDWVECGKCKAWFHVICTDFKGESKWNCSSTCTR